MNKDEPIKLTNYVQELIFKAGESKSSTDAIEFSQAALNIINALHALTDFYEREKG